MVRFAVIDTGIGIPQAEQVAIFQPFSRIHNDDAVPGLGLGLAIAQQLAVAMGGRISVRSSREAPSGSRFELTLALRCCPPEENGREERLPVPVACPAEELERLRQMVSLGQPLAIQKWAQTMAEHYSQDRLLFEEITRCCTRVDLAGLRRIAGNPTAP